MERFEATPELSDKEIEQIIFLSYMFSQGNPSLQKAIMLQIAMIAGLQDPDRMRKRFNAFAKTLEYRENGSYSISRAQIHTNEKLDDPQLHYGDVSAFAERDEDYNKLDLLEIVDEIWTRDYYYLCEKAGRPNRNETEFKVDTLQDPYFSFGVAYLENDKATPSPVFNTFLNRLRQYDVSPDKAPVKAAVLAAYQQHHPEKT